MRSYHPDELFDEGGPPRPEIVEQAPVGDRRMSANPHANGGLLLRDLRLPDFREFAVDVPRPGEPVGEATRQLGCGSARSIRPNPGTFRVMGPDEVASNRLSAVFDVTDRTWVAERVPAMTISRRTVG